MPPFSNRLHRNLLCLISSLALLCAAPVLAQRNTEFASAAAALPPASRAVADRLLSLRQLPDGTWKYHAGDLPHAEDANLDDSNWPTLKMGGHAPNEAVWFRQTIAVPATLSGYDLTGARIWFQFHASANGPMPQIVYFNGRRVALGDDLEPIVLFDNAHPGEKAVIAVKLLHTVDEKIFRGATLHIDFASSRPNPVDLSQEFLSAAVLVPSLAANASRPMATLNNAIAAVDLAALDAHNQQKFDASLKAAQSRMEALRPLLQQATFHLDGNAHIDAAWLWPWTETVDVVKRTFSTALQLMYEYPGYTYTQSAAAYNEWMADKYPDIDNEIKQRIQEGRWEIVGGMWVEPDLNMPSGESLVRQILVGKRWYRQHYGVDVRVGWNPDSFGYNWQLPQIYKKSGIDYFVTQKMTWNDTNQLPFKLFWWQSPDGSRVLTYFPHDYVNLTLNPVRLSEDLAKARQESPGMTELLDLYGVGDHGGGPTRAILDEGFHWKNGSSCASAAGRDPTAAQPNGSVSGHDFSRAEAAPLSGGALAPEGACLVTPNYQFGTAQSFFSAVEPQVAPQSRTWNYQSIAKGYQMPTPVPGKIAIPTWDSELYLEYHRGVYTTQAEHKHNMRTAEEELLNAEKWSSLAWVLAGRAYPSEGLTEDWKKVLFNQFHDLAAGSGIGVIYKDAQKDYDWVRMSTNAISAHALQTVAERVDTKGEGIPVLVYNPLGWERSGQVVVRVQLANPKQEICIADSNQSCRDGGVAFQLLSREEVSGIVELSFWARNVPALGFKLYHVTVPFQPKLLPGQVRIQIDNGRGAPLPSLSDPDWATYLILHGRLTVKVNRVSGCISSIKDPRTGIEFLPPNSCGNQLQFFKDLPKEYDAWNIDPGTYDVPPTTIAKADSVEEIDANTPNPAVRVTYHWQSSKFVQTIRLQGDIVDIDNDIDWHESHVLLKAAFPLAVKSDFATYEIPYGAIERPTTRNNSWEKAQFEVPALRWADLSGAGPDGKVFGLSVLNKDKYGYDAVGNLLRITLLRSPKWPDPNADMGHQHFHYALYPHAGTWKDADTVRHGWEYDYPLQAVVTTAHAGTLPAAHSFASVGPENVVLSAVKKAEDANALIFRAYEWAGKETTAEFHVPPGATGATVTNLMEMPEGAPLTVSGDTVRVPIHPYEILTVRVDYPAGSR
ncbi:MAG: glycoside hydrolase family 38 C-terminal domain-containing protein [Acidobacteriota bacterium]